MNAAPRHSESSEQGASVGHVTLDRIGKHAGLRCEPAGMRGWEAGVWDLAKAEAWHLSALRYRLEARATRQARFERDLRELIGVLAGLMAHDRNETR